jgi:hypothetical protein
MLLFATVKAGIYNLFILFIRFSSEVKFTQVRGAFLSLNRGLFAFAGSSTKWGAETSPHSFWFFSHLGKPCPMAEEKWSNETNPHSFWFFSQSR